MILLFLIFLIFPVAWLVSEFRAKPLARIALGLVAMIVISIVSAQVALVKPQSENKYLHDYADFSGNRVLEIGCGDGRLTWHYARSARQVTGIDLHRDDLRLALIDRPSDLEQKVFFSRADSIHLPLKKQSFDIAILAWSF